nr:unnamed protein product [Callosobruchus analis]
MFDLAKQVAHKWKNLRDYFRKQLKKVPLTRSGGPREEALKNSAWPHFKSLLFLKDQFLQRTSHSNLPYTDDETTIATISTPGVNDVDQCTTPSLCSESEPHTILNIASVDSSSLLC